MAWEYYTFLGVKPDVEWEEIKRAGARKRRELEIARDAAGKAYLNEVTQVLRNPQAREEYDLLQRHGEHVSALITEVREAQRQEDWLRVIRLARQALAQVPDHPLLLNALAYALAANENFRESEKVHADLVKRYPANPIYWASYGGVCLDLARHMAGPETRIADRVDLILTGIQSAKRVPALEKLGEVTGQGFAAAKLLVKAAPQPLYTFVEPLLADSLARSLRAAGVNTKVSPAQGRAMRCPVCGEMNYLPPEFTGRKAVCDVCFNEFTVYRGDRQEMLARGREYLQRAIALDPTNGAYLLDLAQSYAGEGDYAQAVETVNRAIAADGQEDFDDLPALADLCRLYSLLDDQGQLETTVHRMQAVLPPNDPDSAVYASALLASAALVAGALRRYDAVARLARAALLFTPDLPEPRETANTAEAIHRTQVELPQIAKDLQIIDPIKDMARLLVAERMAFLLDPRLTVQLDTAFDTIYDFPRNVIRASAKRVQTKYPAIYKVMRETFTQLLGESL